MHKNLVVADALVIEVNSNNEPIILENSAILVQDGIIKEIGPTIELRRKYQTIPEIGGKGMVGMPGFINAHHHVGLTPFQLGARDQPLELWFAERVKMRDLCPRLDTLFSAFEMISSGVTTVQHLQSRAPGNLPSVLDRANKIIGAYCEVGMRASYSFALRDQNRMIYESDEKFIELLPSQLRSDASKYLRSFSLSLDEQLEVFNILKSKYEHNDLIEVQLAPANLHWLSDRALETTAKIAEQTGAKLHMHLLETPYQAEYAKRRTGGSAVKFINSLGLLGPQMTIGHGVWMTDDDIALMSNQGACLCHNCSSNLRLKSGITDINSFLNENVPIALGIDEAGINDDRDMLQEMRLALTLHRPAGHQKPFPSAAQIFKMATQNGALTTPFSESIGMLKTGMSADIVLFDWKDITWPYQDKDIPLLEVFLRRARRSSVKTVIIGGEIVYKNGRFVKVNHKNILDQIHQDLSRKDTPEELNRRDTSKNILSTVEKFYQGWLEK